MDFGKLMPEEDFLGPNSSWSKDPRHRKRINPSNNPVSKNEEPVSSDVKKRAPILRHIKTSFNDKKLTNLKTVEKLPEVDEGKAEMVKRVKPETSVGVSQSGGVKKMRIEPPRPDSFGDGNEVRYRIKKPQKPDRETQRCVGPVKVIQIPAAATTLKVSVVEGFFGPGYQLFEVSSDIANDEQFLSVLSDDLLNDMMDLDRQQNGDLSEREITFNVSSSPVRESTEKSELVAESTVNEKRLSGNQSSSTNESTFGLSGRMSHLNTSPKNKCDKSDEEEVLKRKKRLENILKKFV